MRRWLVFPIIIILILPLVAAQETKFLPENLEEITLDNVDHLEEIGRLSYGYVTSVVFTPDGEYFLVGTRANLYIYDVAYPQNEPEVIPTEVRRDMVFVSDEQFVIINSSESEIWNFETREQIATLQGTDPVINTEEGTITTTVDEELWVWSLVDGERIDVQDIPSEDDAIPYERPEGSQLVYESDNATSPDGKWWAVAGWGGADLFNNETGESFALVTACCDPAQETVAFSPNSSMLVVGDSNGGVDIWNLEPLQQVASVRHEHSIRDTAFHSDGDILAVASEDGIVRWWDVETRQMLMQFDGFSNRASVLGILADDSRLVVADLEGTASRWDLQTGEHLSTEQGYWFFIGYGTIPLASSINISANATLLATGSYIDGFVRLWTPRGERRGILETHLGNDIRYVAFSNQGDKLVGLTFNGIYLWNIQNGEQITFIDPSTDTYYARIMFTLDDESLLLGTTEGDVHQLHIGSQQIEVIYEGNVGDATPLSVSREGDLIAFANYCYDCEPDERDYTIRVFQQDFPDQPLILSGHEDFVRDLKFSNDGTMLISTADDGTIRFWDTDNGELVKVIDQGASQMTLSLDGTILAVGNWDGTISLFGVPTE